LPFEKSYSGFISSVFIIDHSRKPGAPLRLPCVPK
jgi:hypothetical protein